MVENSTEAQPQEEKKHKVYKRDKNKIYSDSLNYLYGILKGLPQKSPLAYEISRATKLVGERIEEFDEQKTSLMEEYLLRTEDGRYQINDTTKAALEEAAKEEKQLPISVFDFVVDGDEDYKFEYEEKMLELLNEEQTFNFKKVNASKKNVVLENGDKVCLIECISNFFEAGQINFLESVGILEGLD
jgi:hypothetical protein